MDLFRFPLSRLVFFFVFGIILERSLQLKFELLSTASVALLILLGVISYAANRWKWKRLPFEILVSMAFLNCGALCLISHTENSRRGHFSHRMTPAPKSQLIRFMVVEKLRPSKNYYNLVAEIVALDAEKTNGKALIHLSKKTPLPEIGTTMATAARIVDLDRAMNPGQFDYAAFLRNRNIYAQAYAGFAVAISHRKTIGFHADRIRSTIIERLSQAGFPHKELEVFNALLLGQQAGIDSQVKSDYRYSGAVHILSVSGLHVGFLMMMLEFLLRFLPNTKHWRWLKLSVVFAGVWGFAVIAGLSASIVRAATMFSFISFGRQLRRPTNILHTLLISMLLILIFKPGLLFEVGFQLSYAALLFIVSLKPVFDRWYRPKNKPGQYVWDLVTVSVAAQIGTFPLCVYYFHQFPGLFLLTNLLLLPLVGLLMLVGIAAVVAAAIGMVPHWLVFLAYKGIWLMDTIVEKVASFRSLVFDNLQLNLPAVCCCYLFIAGWVAWSLKPSGPRLLLALSAALLLQLSILLPLADAASQDLFVILHQRKNSLIVQKDGSASRLFSRTPENETLNDLAVRPLLISRRISLCSRQKLPNVLTFHRHHILILDSTSVFPKKINPDIVVLTQSPRVNLERLLKEWKPLVVVADGSNFRGAVERWRRSCKKQKIPFHATAEKGSFMLTD